MALFPASMLAVLANLKYIDPWVNSVTNGQHSMVWLYAAFILPVLLGAVFLFKVAPKIPLPVSVPVSIIIWIVFGWYGWNHFI